MWLSVLFVFFIFTLSLAVFAQCVTPPSGLLGWWPGDGSAGDLVGVSHGVLQGGAGFGAGVVGEAFSFDGVNDFVDVGTGAGLRPSGAVSVDAWVKLDPSQLDYPQVFAVRDAGGSSSGYALYLDWYGSRATFGVKENGFGWGDCWARGGPGLKDGKWHHWAGVYDGSSVKVYVDGALVGFDNCRNTGIDYGQNPRALIGGHPNVGGSFLRGLVDEVEVFGRALGDGEVQAVFAAGGLGKCKVVSSVCGNGLVEVGEFCDDGNVLGGDGCGSGCVVESGFACFGQPSVCGVVGSCKSVPGGVVSWWPGDGSAGDLVGVSHGVLQGGAGFGAGVVGE
ncbi:MAG: LamG-like jellyroll fold domain-containing protein, partial [Candidatus Woesearchaeota archaeon]